jgi:hypothetical protein
MLPIGGNPILDHAWGISPSADRVWAEIVGIAPSTRPWERLFVIFRAFIDDSYTADGTFVLAGYIASVEAWADFSKEWEKLLPTALRNRTNGRHRFKMSEMARYMDRVPAFYRVIEEHAIFGLACKINIADLRRATERIWVEDRHIEWGFFNSPYLSTFRFLLYNFHNARVMQSGEYYEIFQRFVPASQKIDFYFDNQSSKQAILSVWDAFVATRADHVRELYGATPRFEDDEDFLPLQAADFWAWWVRRGFEENRIKEICKGDFGPWRANRPIPGVVMSFDEDQLAAEIVSAMRTLIGWSQPIFDTKFHPRPIERATPGESLFARIRRFLRSRQS